MKYKAKILFFFLLAAFHQMLPGHDPKDKNNYRIFDETSPPHVKNFYQLNHQYQTDEYLYPVVKDYLPKQAAYIIRYHSFYAAHCDEAYQELMSDYDKEMIPWLKLFSNYDLYSKSEVPLNIDELKPYYEDLVAEFFPSEIQW